MKIDYFCDKLFIQIHQTIITMIEVNLCSGIGCPCIACRAVAPYQDRDMPHSGLESRIEVNDTFIRDLLLSWLFIFLLCVVFNYNDKTRYYNHRKR